MCLCGTDRASMLLVLIRNYVFSKATERNVFIIAPINEKYKAVVELTSCLSYSWYEYIKKSLYYKYFWTFDL